MSREIVRPAIIRSFGCSPVAARATFRPQAPIVRWIRGVMGLVVCWACGLAAIVFPLQTLSVPQFFHAGTQLARFHWRERHLLLFVEGACPNCGVAQVLHPPIMFPLEHHLYCGSCRQELLVEFEDPLDHPALASTAGAGARPTEVTQ